MNNENSLGQDLPARSLTLTFPFRAISFQQSRMGNGVIYKTEKQKSFESQIEMYLLEQRHKLRYFLQAFNPSEDVIQSSWYFLYDDFFTKKEKDVSSKCLDLDNSIKNIQDVIFKSMEMNDKYVVKTEMFKWLGKSDEIKCSFKLRKRDEIKFMFWDFEKMDKNPLLY